MVKLPDPNPVSTGNIYERNLLFLTIMTVLTLILSEFDYLTGGSIRFAQFVGIVSFILGMVIYYNFWKLARILGYGKVVQRLMLFYWIVWYPIVGVAVPVFWKDTTLTSFKLIISSGMTVQIIYIGFVFWMIMANIFRSKSTKKDHLWGAIICYLIAVVIFADLFRILTLWYPDSISVSFENPAEYYYNCLIYSLNAASGMDYVMPATKLFQKIGIFENWFLNLFLVVILGRLLSVPLEKAN